MLQRSVAQKGAFETDKFQFNVAIELSRAGDSCLALGAITSDS